MNKIIFLIFINSALLIHNCISQWTVISNQGNEAVSFPSMNTGYSTANGITKKTSNGGSNWSTLSGGNLTGIFFINDLTGWVVGYPGYIGKTTNGSSFVQQTTGVQDRLNDVFFIDPNTGWVVGGDFSVERIFKTTDGGANWVTQTSGTANKLFSVYFIDANTGWSVGGPSSPKIIKTTNGGTNWNTEYTNVSSPLYSVMFADANTGWAVAGYIGGETIIKTTDGGSNWFSQTSGDSRYLRDCWVLSPAKAFAVGQGGKIIVTTDGVSWSVEQTGSSIELWAIDFPNDSIGYAIGDNVVLKTTNGGLSFVNGKNTEIAKQYKLYQNYPNPFNPSTMIKYEFPILGNVKLVIYDVSGKEIITPVNEMQNAGSYNIEFDGSNFASGVYFYKLSVSNEQSETIFSDTKKMILMK
ncbi:MAG: YCF48-related protein [Ignavibacteria bacterium]